MSEVLNLKYMLPERLHGRYISNDQIKRDPRPRDADIDTLAHVLVSERHGKFDLVHLVAYLLRECASSQADDARDAGEVLAAIESGEWDISKVGPSDALSDAGNAAMAFCAQRIRYPFEGADGACVWFGPSAVAALRKAKAAIAQRRKGE